MVTKVRILLHSVRSKSEKGEQRERGKERERKLKREKDGKKEKRGSNSTSTKRKRK
jgi:hypothetical protein